MKIYTTYFAKARRLPSHVKPISICAYPPSWFAGPNFEKLAPNKNILMEYKQAGDTDEFSKRYKEDTLARLNPEDVVEELRAMTSTKDVALVCFEKSEDFCHRHLIAQWLREHGIEAEEWK